MTESRERRLEDLQEALDENTKSKAIEKAAKFTGFAGGCTGVPQGQLAELMEVAEKQRSVTDKEIAEILNTKKIPIGYHSEWSIGNSPQMD